MKVNIRKSAKSAGIQRIFFYTDSFLFYRKESFFYEWENGNSYIRMPCRWENGMLTSLSHSSFGGFDFSEDITQDQLTLFLQEVNQLAVSHCDNIIIRTYPACYAPAIWEIQHNALLGAGYTVRTRDLNMHLPIHNNTFRESLHPSENRYLNFAENEKWQFMQLDPNEYLTRAYDLFLDARVRKQYTMTMDLTELQSMYHLFPENYLLFGVLAHDELIAVSTAIRINAQILYDFYHGDNTNFRSKSPVVYLYNGLYDYAKHQGMSVLDQGICSENGRINEGLCTFKRNMGGKESSKNTYEKLLK